MPFKASPQTEQAGISSAKKIEWIVAGISACLFAALVVYLMVLGLFSGASQAAFQITTAQPQQRGHAFYVDFTLMNTGAKSAADVHVAAKSASEGPLEIVFDYVPAGSLRRGTLVFSSTEPPANLDISVISYREP
jgi:uncharacterized protein (TIGR02588 family)